MIIDGSMNNSFYNDAVMQHSVLSLYHVMWLEPITLQIQHILDIDAAWKTVVFPAAFWLDAKAYGICDFCWNSRLQ